MPGVTLEELEGIRWGPPEFESHVVVTCYRLRSKPVDEFTVEDLRIMIGQNIGLTHLLPRAVAILETNPLAEGDCFAGDLLSAVLCAERSVIQNNAELLRRISAVAETVQSSLNAGPGPNPRRVEEKLLSEIAQFKAGGHGAC